MDPIRKIIHIDMDAFYAAIEQRDRPELKGLPVIVGGDPDKRGVVATCSYEARKFGIHSAMSARTARTLCPQAVFLRPRMDAYVAESQKIREIFHDYTDLVEPLSLDEAYLDVTENKRGLPSATQTAQEIKSAIWARTGLTASAGVSYNKFLAKVASDMNKPDGLTVVKPAQAQAFIDRLPIRKFFHVGKVTEKKMLAHGIRTGADLKARGLEELVRLFGKAGNYFYACARGEDRRPVDPVWIRKSYGRETTLEQDLTDEAQIRQVLRRLAECLAAYVLSHRVNSRTLTLKVKYHDFVSVTRQAQAAVPLATAEDMLALALALLAKTEAGRKPVRLLGLSLSRFADPPPNPSG
jgi:DNA polymerase IV